MKGKFTRPAFTACLMIYAAPAMAQDRTDAQRTDPQVAMIHYSIMRLGPR